jgi:hypothetical protein
VLPGSPSRKGALGRAGIEGLAAGQERLHLGERGPHGLGERQRPGGGPHPLGPAGEQLVAEQGAQAGEIVAHRRLAEPDPGRGAGDAALREQGVEGDEEVEVEAGQISVVDCHHRSDRLD